MGVKEGHLGECEGGEHIEGRGHQHNANAAVLLTALLRLAHGILEEGERRGGGKKEEKDGKQGEERAHERRGMVEKRQVNGKEKGRQGERGCCWSLK